MDFGQTLDERILNAVHFSLPPLDTEEEIAQLERLRRARENRLKKGLEVTSPVVRVGVPVWAEAKWVGSVYPAGTKSSEYLSAYQEQFQTVEVNSSFYAVPNKQVFQKWTASVGPEFKFCPKFPKSVSHQLASPNSRDLEAFFAGLESMRERIGLTFLQLPATFGAKMGDTKSRQLLQFLESVPRWVKPAVEFRHPIFMDNRRLEPEWVEALSERFVATTIVDTPLEQSVSHMSLTSPRVMIRFLGANLHDTDWTRLDAWINRAVTWIENGLSELYFLVHEPDNVLSPKAAQYFIRGLNRELARRQPGVLVREPFIQELL